MASNTKTIYILGAGASANALPQVSDMVDRLLLFNKFISSVISNFSGAPQLRAKIFEFVDGTKKYQTPDTFAKVLKLQRKEEEYNLFKNYLSLFFSFEQIGFSQLDFLRELTFSPEEHKLIPSLTNDLDYRYVQFISSIFHDLSLETLQSAQFRIITWNYDIQFELILSRILNCSVSEIFWKCNLPQGDSPFPLISRMNGIAMLFKGKEKNLLIDQYLQRPNWQNAIDFAETCFLILSNNDRSWDNAMSFAWDNHIDSLPIQDIRAQNTKRVQTDHHLVIIGYSFPNFNRTIDWKLMNALAQHSRTTVYQVPEAFPESIRTLFPFISENCNPVTDKRQFYVPNELLGN